MVAISRLTQQIIRAYDENRDGVINIKPGLYNESTRLESQRMTFPDRDELLISKVSHAQLFAAADANGDLQVTAAELKKAIASFDANGDGKLKNSGPFWKRRGELRDFNKAFPEQRRIVDRRVIYKPRPPQTPFPGDLPGRFPGRFPRAFGSAAVGQISLAA